MDALYHNSSKEVMSRSDGIEKSNTPYSSQYNSSRRSLQFLSLFPFVLKENWKTKLEVNYGWI